MNKQIYVYIYIIVEKTCLLSKEKPARKINPAPKVSISSTVGFNKKHGATKRPATDIIFVYVRY